MKKRTLLTTLFLLILSVGAANAQLSDWRFRVDASVNFSKGDYKIEKVNDLTTKAIVGYRIGGAVNIPFSSMLYFAPGITFLSKGSKTTIKDRNFGDVKTRTHHIEIPLHVGLRVPIGETLAFNVQFGPYLSYAIAGTAKTDNNKDIDIFKDGIKDMWKEKRFDVGLGAAAWWTSIKFMFCWVQTSVCWIRLRVWQKTKRQRLKTRHSIWVWAIASKILLKIEK
ncbi:porin family protein [Porphyromonas macacae]|uniref:porin family protein n=1 Tax=Porphyromonas macacae TaxID=28115 RepID=UPI001F5A15B7|nr:porin family protein [Porphyromonas macacae]